MMGATGYNAHSSSATGPRQAGRGGFTLTELLVVIGIGVLLMALLVPTGQALRAGNRALTCKSQMQQIGTAVKAYYMDEGGAPPFYADEFSDLDDPDATGDYGPGLMSLYDTGYLARRESLHCPADVYAQVGQSARFESYQGYDEDAAANLAVNSYPYLNTRGITDDTDPLYRRQLQPAVDTDGNPSTAPRPVTIPHWRPNDDTVITWCPFHTDDTEVGGEGAYQVLFWDGSVLRVRESVMTDPAIGPDAAWKVTYADAG